MTVVGACGPEMLFNDAGNRPGGKLRPVGLPRISSAAGRLSPAAGDSGLYQLFTARSLIRLRRWISQVDAFLRQIGGQAWVEGHVTWLRLSLLLVRRDFSAFSAAVEEARTRMAANSVNVEFLPGLIYLQARAAWERGDLAANRGIALDELAQPQTMPLVTTEDEIRRLILQGLMALSARKFAQGERASASRCRPASERPPYRFSARSPPGAGRLIRRMEQTRRCARRTGACADRHSPARNAGDSLAGRRSSPAATAV